MLKSSVTPSGEIKLVFSEPIQPIKNIYKRSLRKIMKMTLKSFEFGKTMTGSQIPKPKSRKKKSRK
jgi:hypothetical protein